MTVLFCDLVGSSELALHLDPEEFAELIVAYRELCVAVVTRHGGYISRYVGDGVLACFGYPRATGRDAQAAVACGLAIALELSRLACETTLHGGRDLAVRIGIETGLVLAGRLGTSSAAEADGLVGTAPNVAARLQGLSDRNGVVIGEATHELVFDAFQCEELPTDRTLKLQPRSRVFAVRTAITHLGPRFLTRRRVQLIGRHSEMGNLRDRWERATAGLGQTVLLSGEAGIGKSRLCQELLEELDATSHYSIVLRCTPQDSSSAFHPAIEQVRNELAHETDANGRVAPSAESIAQLVNRLGFGDGAGQTVLTEALGLDPAATLDRVPAARRRLLLNLLQAWLLGHAQDRPLLIVVEDLQWSDPSLLELLGELSDVLVIHKILLIATYRSHFVAPLPDRPTSLRMSLSPLALGECRQILEALPGVETGERREAILAKSEGVPLFLEEFALGPATAVPRTLQQLFTARLDSLGDGKRLAQCAAVLDPQIEPDLLADLSGLSRSVVDQRIRGLVAAEWLVHAASTPNSSFAFRHALLREATSESLLRSERRTMHARTAALLRARRRTVVAQQPEVVAHHHMLGGQPDQAVGMYIQAARRALEGAALAEAETHIENGLIALGNLKPDQDSQSELDLQVLRGHTTIARRGYANATVRVVFEEALAIALRAPQQAQTIVALRGLASFYQVRGPLSRAASICDQLVAAAEHTGDPLLLVDALRRRGWNRACMGRLTEAEDDLSRALETFDPARRSDHIRTAGHDPQVLALANLAWLHGPRYGLKSAVGRAEAAAAAAHASPHAVSACYGLVLPAFILQQANRWDDALAQVNRAREIAAEKGFAYWVALAEVATGFDQAMRRDAVDAGIKAIRVGLASYCETQGELLRPFILSLIAEAEAAGGNLGSAHQAMEEALATAEALEAFGFIPDLLLRHARLLNGAGCQEQRRSVLMKGLAAARAQGADAIASLLAAGDSLASV